MGRWISLNDGISIDDISFTLERALTASRYKHLLESGFHVVIHSTGAVVIRNWIRLFDRKPSPIYNLVHLAGANFGSGLAHIGQGQLARWGRIVQGVERGVRVLEELEFGSWKTLDLHLDFLQAGSDMWEDYRIQEFCMVGSQTLGELRMVPVRYVKEDSADNTVRTSAANLNFNYITVAPIDEAFGIKLREIRRHVEHRIADDKLPIQYYRYDASQLATHRREIPFAVLYETAHFGRGIGIVDGQKNRRRVLPLLTGALSQPHDADAYRDTVGAWHQHSVETFGRAGKLKGRLTEWNPQAQYEGHAQLVFRVRDQFGGDVEHHDITFKSRGPRSQLRLERLIEDKHVNRLNPGTVTFYLRLQKFRTQPEGAGWVNLLDRIASLDFEITGYEARSGDIHYLPLTITLRPTIVRRIIQPFHTTLIDVTLLRLPSEKVFALSPSKA